MLRRFGFRFVERFSGRCDEHKGELESAWQLYRLPQSPERVHL